MTVKEYINSCLQFAEDTRECRGRTRCKLGFQFNSRADTRRGSATLR